MVTRLKAHALQGVAELDNGGDVDVMEQTVRHLVALLLRW
jgi:hypothetical protein